MTPNEEPTDQSAIQSRLLADSAVLADEEARLWRQLETADERTARLFAATCAEHVLNVFERRMPNDPRPRHAIQAVREYANGLVDRHALLHASHAAMEAANEVHTRLIETQEDTTDEMILAAAADAARAAALAADEGPRAGAWRSAFEAAAYAAQATTSPIRFSVLAWVARWIERRALRVIAQDACGSALGTAACAAKVAMSVAGPQVGWMSMEQAAQNEKRWQTMQLRDAFAKSRPATGAKGPRDRTP
jgi:hypothetical protein